ncbi:MAG: hypothetical protein J6A04_03495 [Clostridia bacterium]|nr:hypothetical protein [Clostridia bacterium]
MDKQEILKNYKKEEDRLLVSKMLDKIVLCAKRNKIQNTDFLDERQKSVLEKVLHRIGIENYIIFGGFDETERNTIIFYPEKWNKEIVEKNYDSIMQVIGIVLPSELKGKYIHRDYLGGLMKLGLKREKIGDIVVWEEGADIIVLKEIVPFLEQHLSTLTRFQKAGIIVKLISNIHPVNIQKEKIEITVSSMRLDNIVSELAKTSRTKAEEIIRQERVVVNYETVTKDSKILKIGDKITIRGKGKFEIKEMIGNTKKGRTILNIEKYT